MAGQVENAAGCILDDKHTTSRHRLTAGGCDQPAAFALAVEFEWYDILHAGETPAGLRGFQADAGEFIRRWNAEARTGPPMPEHGRPPSIP